MFWSFVEFDPLFLVVEEGGRGRKRLLAGSISGFRADTIREASDGSRGDQTSRLPTRQALVCPGLCCGLGTFTHHVNKSPELRVLWFSTPENKDFAAFLVAVQIQQGPGMPAPCEKYLYQ